MKLRWDVDDSTVVEADFGPFGKRELTVNGQSIPNQISLRKKGEFRFNLADGRAASITIKPQFGGAPVVELRVEGQLMVPTGKTPVKCSACGTVVKPNDRFCGKCGHAMPPAENYVHEKHQKEATGTIWLLAALFFISGVVLFFIAKSQADPVLAKLNGLDPNAAIPNAIDGVKYTVGTLRDRINFETWSVLYINLILAAAMVGLALWGRRAPLAAILVAAATYAVVVVTNAIFEPASIGQGIYMKIIIILFLVRGIRGALALRTANA